MPESPEAKWYQYRRTPGTAAAGPWIVAWIICRSLVQILEPTEPVRVLLALVPLPFFLLFLHRFLVHMRASDELQRRIQLEALAIAFPLTIALLTTLGLLQTAGIEPAGGWSVTGLWIYAGLFYLIGRRIARHRYT